MRTGRPTADWHQQLRNLDLRLAALEVDARSWQVLDARAGIGHSSTLQEVADQHGVSRARVGQIDINTRGKLARRLGIVAPAFDSLEQQAPEKGEDEDPEEPIELLEWLRLGLIRDGWQPPHPDSVVRLPLIVRALIDYGTTWIIQRWPRLSLLLCRIDPPIRAHPDVESELRLAQARERELARTWSYHELAVSVLAAHGAQLHWRIMADRAERLGHRQSFNQTAFYNALNNNKRLVRVGPGTFALTEWGQATAIPYPDIIADILSNEPQPLTFGEIYLRVHERRTIKPTSLQMLLDMHPRFYLSENGLYGLRVRLPPRHKQTLLTPDELVEAEKSFRRIARAEARGYHVNDMLQRDRQTGGGR